jgi:hypothetical protein
LVTSSAPAERSRCSRSASTRRDPLRDGGWPYRFVPVVTVDCHTYCTHVSINVKQTGAPRMERGTPAASWSSGSRPRTSGEESRILDRRKLVTRRRLLASYRGPARAKGWGRVDVGNSAAATSRSSPALDHRTPRAHASRGRNLGFRTALTAYREPQRYRIRKHPLSLSSLHSAAHPKRGRLTMSLTRGQAEPFPHRYHAARGAPRRR